MLPAATPGVSLRVGQFSLCRGKFSLADRPPDFVLVGAVVHQAFDEDGLLDGMPRCRRHRDQIPAACARLHCRRLPELPATLLSSNSA
ncbi:hypothetical protein G3I59_41395 [Amycolatopsis rubida]|uniref:Uncharacterized protein n=1 Tax=Amycolatopsis rubida TaxID=112413 RepID=A0ABX0C3L9_9PSEU|nr:hypothetical protein [Amycolatopsis rubida]MYW96899.1 hypothetical protein [Amycolatopsis rubida]NEC61884.1 hypothetical protein [Amycolatopsis rubida]